eukprot:CAMPEP_0201935614 /NCGR_PEP_ID=MMETSP0903-20130614/35845_1 /ASSEMBLY_ACC=CAM_ASM_000552 /TAXON_ID=420261 /ORGANISM="Thalassiosira antarctica, Strain CCMP982" /LENGTH=51 /DNA_ID=CAMNT_0048476073 /DNA_START=54 /DNA_END=209 /DNA_ORIENTATION=+
MGNNCVAAIDDVVTGKYKMQEESHRYRNNIRGGGGHGRNNGSRSADNSGFQ